MRVSIDRLPGNPIIRPGMDARMGSNINGPSLIRTPGWLQNPLGRYYLYFAHHRGTYIRMAFADDPTGPWRVYAPGVLGLDESFCEHHVASPDVHIDEDRKQIRMYYHGPTTGGQRSRVAISSDGLHFAARAEILGEPYFRVFRWQGYYYALAMPGIFHRSPDGLSGFVSGPRLFTDDMRHSAVRVVGQELQVFYSNVGDRPERILLATIDLSRDWMQWRPSNPVTVLQPGTEYEGADLPLVASVRGWAPERVRQLRDPAVFTDGPDDYLLYSVAGESGIAIAQLKNGQGPGRIVR